MASAGGASGLKAIQDSNEHPSILPFDGVSEEEGEYCRICRGEATEQQPLFYPCKCSGSIKYVHQDCLMEWLSHSQKKHCELCKTPFRFTKLYDQSMPSKLPFPLFLQQLMVHAGRSAARWTRYLLVSCIWTCCLPWFIRQVWRGLFWIVDGNWSSGIGLQTAGSNNTSAVAGLQNGSFVESSLHAVTQDIAQQVEPPLLRMFWNFISFLTGESIVARTLRTLLPITITSAKSTENANASSESDPFLTPKRQPSILSEVHFINSLTPYNSANEAFIDILEGQLICIILIATFILVFLIREWVINQQPILNMPDPEVAENPAVHAEPHEEVRQIARRRRRLLRRAGDQPPVAEDVDRGTLARQEGLRPRRALTEDNIGIATTTNAIETPMIRPRSRSLSSTDGQLPRGLTSTEADAELHAENIDQIEPPPLTRGSLGNVVNIQRNIEETSGLGEGYSSPDLEARADPEKFAQDAPVLNVESEPTLSSITSEQEPGKSIVQHNSTLQPTSESQIYEPVAGSRSMQSEDNKIAATESDSDDIVMLTPGSATSTNREGDTVVETEDAPQYIDPATEQQSNTPTPPSGQSLLEPIAAWLWQTDDYVAPTNTVGTQGDQQIIGDPQAEAPFVPIRDGVVINPPAGQQPAPIPEALELPAVQIEGEWNEQNPVDDAEDLDGILELIGMEGPISGMIQNVIFSVFLITVTLTASIWIPYIWGKITLLFLAHPVKLCIKAPLFMLSKTADVVADVLFLFVGLFGFFVDRVAKVLKLLTTKTIPSLNGFINTERLEQLSTNLSRSSGARLERTLTNTVLALRPDLPTFSMQSHHALNIFKQSVATILFESASCTQQVWSTITNGSWNTSTMIKESFAVVRNLIVRPGSIKSSYQEMISRISSFSHDIEPLSFKNGTTVDAGLAVWSTEDKVIAIVLGYMLIAFAGMVFLKAVHWISGLKNEDKVEGNVADTLRQAGGVMKVIVIIGIEMIVFPLYCGLLLDFALLPLFEDATVHNRLTFLRDAPLTGIFVHWFIGTCYMFHFALFVSMCRKIIRKGVLYFIRDPDDPTFHPVRDVLERPVPTQLGKIASSALVYGGLVIMCLGGVVWTLKSVGGVLPIQWATAEPRLAFPVDVVFYNFMLPFVVRKAEPSKKIAMMYEWWFRGCAGGLRLTHFLFGQEREEEKHARSLTYWFGSNSSVQQEKPGPEMDGIYVRTPASDSVRIPKGQRVFLEVDENNNRMDGKLDLDIGMHGKYDERFTKVYIPPRFRARIVTFIFLVWVFAAATGVAVTIIPLLVGRQVVKIFTGSGLPANDLYALTVGIHVCAGLAYCLTHMDRFRQWAKDKAEHWLSNTQEALPQLWNGLKYTFGLVYLFSTFGIILPFILSLIVEVYIHVPLFTYVSSGNLESQKLKKISSRPIPTVFILQTWTLGLLYLRVALRVVLNYPNPQTRVATAIRAIVRNGILHPDVRLASRAIILPSAVLCTSLLLAPLGYAKLFITMFRIQNLNAQTHIYRFAYPLLLGAGIIVFCLLQIKNQLSMWRVKIKDEVYLIGERLHNFQETRPKTDKGKAKAD